MPLEGFGVLLLPYACKQKVVHLQDKCRAIQKTGKTCDKSPSPSYKSVRRNRTARLPRLPPQYPKIAAKAASGPIQTGSEVPRILRPLHQQTCRPAPELPAPGDPLRASPRVQTAPGLPSNLYGDIRLRAAMAKPVD